MSEAKTPNLQRAGLTGAALLIAVTVVSAYEGLSTKPYRDSVGVLTVCYGATAADYVDLSKTYTPAECKAMLGTDLQKYYQMVTSCVHVPMPPHREAAMVSFTYNVGGGAFCKSAVARDLNAGRVQAACDALLAYNRAGGRVLAGLTARRKSERTLCLMEN